MDNKFQQVIQQFPPWFSDIADAVPMQARKHITELHVFEDQTVFWRCGKFGRSYDSHHISRRELQEIFVYLCNGSVHCYQQEIEQGFLTLNGGHRVGLCGTVLWQNGTIAGLRDISSITVRIAHQIKGCAIELNKVMGNKSFLIAGAPGTGKTTLLRDYIRLICKGTGECNEIAAVLDERRELSGFDLGQTAHVIKGLPKSLAIRQALRTLAPQVIICDEIGSEEEAQLLSESLNCGCRFVGTIHAEQWDKLCLKAQFLPFLAQNSLDAVVFLEGQGKIREIREVNAYENHRMPQSILQCSHLGMEQKVTAPSESSAMERNERFAPILF